MNILLAPERDLSSDSLPNQSFRTQQAPQGGANAAFANFQRAHDTAAATAALASLDLADSRYAGSMASDAFIDRTPFSAAHPGGGYLGVVDPHSTSAGLDMANYRDFLGRQGGPQHAISYAPPNHAQGPAGRAITSSSDGVLSPALARASQFPISPRYDFSGALDDQFIPALSHNFPSYDFGGEYAHRNISPYFQRGMGNTAWGMAPVGMAPVAAPGAEFIAANAGPLVAHPETGNVGPVATAAPAGPAYDADAFNAAFGEYDEQEFDREIDSWIQDNGAQETRAGTVPTTEEMAEIDANLEDMANELEERRAAGDPAVLPQRGPEAEARRTRKDQEDLVRAATGILSSVSDNQSDKFKNSSFLDLMRRIQNYEIVVSGTDLVDAQTGETIMSKDQVNGHGSTAPLGDQVEDNESKASTGKQPAVDP